MFLKVDHLQKSGWKHQGSRVQGFQGSSEVLKYDKELKVWQKFYQWCLKIYKTTKRFP